VYVRDSLIACVMVKDFHLAASGSSMVILIVKALNDAPGTEITGTQAESI